MKHCYKLLSELIQLHQECDRLVFHDKSEGLLRSIGTIKVLSEVFEANLLNDQFIRRKWSSFDIPHLPIYSDTFIDLKYHMFMPARSKKMDVVSYLIHDHMDYILSSYVLMGGGYRSFEFEKDYRESSGDTLTISKEFYHGKNSFYVLDSWRPHVICKVVSPTATLVLWSKGNSKNDNDKTRKIYYPKGGRLICISEEKFIDLVKNNVGFEDNSEQHIQAICFFMQELGYQNTEFLKDLIYKNDLPVRWKTWLSYLYSGKKIDCPYFNYEINTLQQEITITEIINVCR